MRKVGSSVFGACVLSGREEGGMTCEKGLPIVTSSIRILGRFQRMLGLNHESLCQYIELIRCSVATNCVILISEHHTKKLCNLTAVDLATVARQLISGLCALHLEGIVAGILRPKTVCIVSEDPLILRMSEYGLSYISNDGKDLVDPPGPEHGISPEQLVAENPKASNSSFASDIWMLGILLLEMSTGIRLEQIWPVQQYKAILLSLMKDNPKSLLDPLLRAIRSTTSKNYIVSEELKHLVEECLTLMPSGRPCSLDLAKRYGLSFEPTKKIWPTTQAIKRGIIDESEDRLQHVDLDLAFFLWKLTGSNIENILAKEGIIRLQFAISSAPHLVVEDMQMFGNDAHRRAITRSGFSVLPYSNLQEKLRGVDVFTMFYSVELSGLPWPSQLPVVVKEKSALHQLTRTRIMRSILLGRRDLVLAAANEDIPPLVRCKVWAALMGINSPDMKEFYNLDVIAPHACDKQLDVDIPRCHQYEELMTSPTAHWQLRLLVKAWLLRHPKYVYWQGCDSLSTPFLLLNFNNLPIALNCLSSFIEKYLYNFFLKDNSVVIQEYLAVFHVLIAFVDAALYSRLIELDFYPELFAIPWFLTCFAHVLPIYKLYHVWDKILLHDCSFPLFVGLSLLNQVRHRLIDSTFNDAILLFSDLPDLPMERLISDSGRFFEQVPPSCTHRIHQSPPEAGGMKCLVRSSTPNEIRRWNCPRLAAADLKRLCKTNSIDIFDTRSPADFALGHVIGAINICSSEVPKLVEAVASLNITEHHRPICVLGGRDEAMTVKVCSALVLELHVNGVCVLDGGFEMIRHEVDLLVV